MVTRTEVYDKDGNLTQELDYKYKKVITTKKKAVKIQQGLILDVGM